MKREPEETKQKARKRRKKPLPRTLVRSEDFFTKNQRIDLGVEGCTVAIGKIPENIPIDQLRRKLAKMRPEKKIAIRVMGHTEAPRYGFSCWKPYTYSGVKHAAKQEIPEEMEQVLDWVNSAQFQDTVLKADLPLFKDKNDKEKQTKFTIKAHWAGPCTFNQALINYYPDGKHSIGQHSDDETKFAANRPVVGLNLGPLSGSRKFVLRPKSGKGNVFEVILPNKTWFVMEGLTQKHFTHEIPKTARPVGERISITFRHFL